MVNNSVATLDKVFGALSDPTRRAILDRLSNGEQRVTDLAAPFRTSLPAISKHLNVLEDAGLIVRRSSGRLRYCSISAAPMETASEWLDHYRRFWMVSLDALDEYLKREGREDQNPPSKGETK